MTKLRIAVIGAGLIGRKHVALIQKAAVLSAIIDPAPSARAYAEEVCAPWHSDLETYLETETPDGVVIATPNQLHTEQAMACIAAGIPMLIEKPIADKVAPAEAMLRRAEAADVPVLVGHHRRHNPLISAARQAIQSGEIGRIVSVNAMFWLFKPAPYFDAEWRTKEGAGPVFVNLIHDIDLLRYLCGEIVTVQAMQSNDVRGFEVEDTAAILLRFANGALGTVTVSDTIVAPWSWELSSAENKAYPATGASCYKIGGTKGALSIPDMNRWHQTGATGWYEPIEKEKLQIKADDPLVRQIQHFCDVITGQARPLVSGQEGLATLRAVEAIKRAAKTGQAVHL